MMQLLKKSPVSQTIADLWLENGLILVEAHHADRMLVQTKMKSANSLWYDSNMLTWGLQATPSVAENLYSIFGERAQYHPTFLEALSGRISQVQANTIKEIPDEELPEIPNLIGSSWGHQKRAYSYMAGILGLDDKKSPGGAGVGLFADMGTGKSRVTVGLIVGYPEKIKRTLVVCPKRVIPVWPDEFTKHVPSDKRPLIAVPQGSVKERAAFMLEYRNTPGVYIVNYDVMVYDDFQKAIIKCGWDLIVLDEAHRIKAPGGKTSKFLARLGNRVPYRIAQTGTPNADKPLDVYGLYRFLDQGIFGSRYADFTNKYAVFGGYQGREIIEYKNLDVLSEKMYTIAFRVTDEVLDLPRVVSHTKKVKLGPKARAAYEQMKKDMIVSIENGSATVQNTLTKALRLQQITSGYLPIEMIDENNPDAPLTKETAYFEDDKYEALLEIMEDMPENEPLVVFCKFLHDLDNVRKATGASNRPYMELSGRRDDYLDFKNRGGNRTVLGVQITAGGSGVDLTRSRYGVYYSLTHSLTSYDQSFKRMQRPGMRDTGHYYYLIAENTIDGTILRALKEKKSVATYVLDLARQGVPWDVD